MYVIYLIKDKISKHYFYFIYFVGKTKRSALGKPKVALMIESSKKIFLENTVGGTNTTTKIQDSSMMLSGAAMTIGLQKMMMM